MIAATGRALTLGKPHSLNRFKLFIEDPMDDHEVCLHLEVSIEGPGKSEITTKNFGNGTIGVEYRVAKIGQYAVHVTFQNQHIQGSPFKLLIK